MRILVHDYAGHPFQVHLSRYLAIRGHHVTHLYFAEDPGPKGTLERRAGDPDQLQFHGIHIGRTYDKNSLLRRRFGDLAYGRRAAEFIQNSKPDLVISGNTPTEAQKALVRACKRNGIRFVYWLQDFYSVAVSTLLRKRLGLFGLPIGWYYRQLERQQLRSSDAIVTITPDFVPLASAWCGHRAKVTVIENWAAVDDLPMGSRNNEWSRLSGFENQFTFLYSGTLGLKHNPGLLIRLAAEGLADTSVVAVAEGVGVSQLKAAKAGQALPRLRLLPLQPASRLAEVLASANVLVAVIERDAGHFAVPSKVQSYLCAGRPILLAAPPTNLAARIVQEADAGIVVDPDDQIGFIAAAARLRNDPALCSRLGANGRAYAEQKFDLNRIAEEFESVFAGCFTTVGRTR